MKEANDGLRISFEFFPPQTSKGAENLKEVRAELQKLHPDFFSITYGAGGSTRDNSRDLVLNMRSENLPVAPHLSFGSDDEETIIDLLNTYKEAGVNRIVALRGDIPSGFGNSSKLMYANQLVQFIRNHFNNSFEIEVAAYPEIHPNATSYSSDINYLKKKLDAGANNAITQYFYNPDSYFHFVDECDHAGIKQPIYPGIMPILNYAKLAKFSDACGAEIPRWIKLKLSDFGDDENSIRAFGEDLVTELCDTLLSNGAPGLHFYTMNQIEPTRQIIENLGLEDTE